MTYGVWIPLLAPLIAVPLARCAAGLLHTRTAPWLLSGLTVLLALSSTAALALIAFAGVLRLPVVAGMGHLSVPLLNQHAGPAGPTAATAAVLLAAIAAAVLHTVAAQCRELAVTRAATQASLLHDGELAVRPDSRPYAFALPGRPGRIVVTTGMLHALTAAEREALFAHERAHLVGRHHLFLAVAECAAACHPLLRGLRGPISRTLERTADEAAVRATGDRRLVARAVARAALAASPHPGRPSVLLGVATGPVPRRVEALLRPSRTKRVRWETLALVMAAALAVCAGLSAASALEAAHDLHASIEFAQGESPSAGW